MKKNKKTVILNDNHLGALVHFRREVILALIEDGYNVILVAPYNGEDMSTIPLGAQYVPVVFDRVSKGLKDAKEYMTQLKVIFKKYKPDIVFNYTIKPIILGGLVCHFMHIRSVAFFAGLNNLLSDAIKENSFKAKILKLVLGNIIKCNHALVFLNLEDLNFIQENLGIQRNVILFDGGEGVDLSKYHCEYNGHNNLFKVVMVARVLKSKGYGEFVEVAHKIHKENLPIRMYLAGGIDSSHPDRVSKEIIEEDAQNGEFSYEGHVDNIIEFLKDTSCVILPSYYNEGMNRSLMEALSLGIPIITTDNRGCRELVIDGATGFVIPIQDSSALYSRIMKLYKMSKEERLQFSKNSREYARKRFDVKHVIAHYKQLIESF